jgi:hypothetical protein
VVALGTLVWLWQVRRINALTPEEQADRAKRWKTGGGGGTSGCGGSGCGGGCGGG